MERKLYACVALWYQREILQWHARAEGASQLQWHAALRNMQAASRGVVKEAVHGVVLYRHRQHHLKRQLDAAVCATHAPGVVYATLAL